MSRERVGDGLEVAVEPDQPVQTLDFSNLPVYMTPLEAADYLRFTVDCRFPVKAFWKWAERNHVRQCHRGSKVLFRRVDLDAAADGFDFVVAAALDSVNGKARASSQGDAGARHGTRRSAQTTPRTARTVAIDDEVNAGGRS